MIGVGLSIPELAVRRRAAAPANPELFPDPNLTHVTDALNGWRFGNDYPSFGATGGTGPGISAGGAFEDDSGQLFGAYDMAFGPALVEGASYTVAITFSSVSVAKPLYITIAQGAGVNFIPAVGIVTHTMVAGPYDAGAGNGWLMVASGELAADPGGVYDITKISVKAA